MERFMFVLGPFHLDHFTEFMIAAIERPHCEFEIRFSETWDKSMEKDLPSNAFMVEHIRPLCYNFVKYRSVSMETFHAVMRYCQSLYPSHQEWIVDTIYESHLRHSAYYHDKDYKNPEKDVWITKHRETFFDLWQLPIRLVFSREEPNNAPEHAVPIVQHERKKNRTCFLTPCGLFRIDLTIVDNESAEIEMEFLPELLQRRKTIRYDKVRAVAFEFARYCTDIVKVIRGARFEILGLAEHYNVMKEYAALVKSPNFVGCQPESLFKCRAPRLKQEPFVVSRKYNGERALLFISSGGDCYTLTRALKISALPCQQKLFANSVFDTEVMSDSSIYVFDVLIYKGHDLRILAKMTIAKRIWIVNVLTQATHFLHQKPIFTGPTTADAYKACIATPDPIVSDGLIFTAAHRPYPITCKAPFILKWKRSEENSIDFQVKLIDNHFHFFVWDKKSHVPFGPHKSQIAPATESIQWHDKIVECTWNKNSFVLNHLRIDKVRANSVAVALDIWRERDTVFTDALLQSWL